MKNFWCHLLLNKLCLILSILGRVTCICRDTGICHYSGYFFGSCSRTFGYLFVVFPDFWVSFFGYSRIFGYHFLVKFDFFKNNPDFGVLILIFPSMTLRNVPCRALVSMILQFSFLFYHACAMSSILSITAISLSFYICSAFWFWHHFTIVDNFQCTKIKADE